MIKHLLLSVNARENYDGKNTVLEYILHTLISLTNAFDNESYNCFLQVQSTQGKKFNTFNAKMSVKRFNKILSSENIEKLRFSVFDKSLPELDSEVVTIYIGYFRAASLEISISEDLVKENHMKYQAVLLDLLIYISKNLNVYHGYITFDLVRAGMFSATAHEKHYGIGHLHNVRSGDLNYLRGYFWANLICKNQIDKLGGLDNIKNVAPYHDLIILDDQHLVLILTESVIDVNDSILAQLKNYVKPLLQPRQMDVPEDHYKYTRHIPD